MESPSNADLPADIIRGILLNLSVKILLQFKCVCKEWNTLIESQSFVNDHFVNESNQERLLVFKPDRHRLVCVDESEPFHLPMPGKVLEVMGPLNGVFCVVSSSGGVGLFNPALRQFKPLPRLSSCHSFLGFGLDPLSGYFKVVSIQLFWKRRANSPMYPPLVHVYDSGSGSWRSIKDVLHVLYLVRCAFRSRLSSTYLNGVCYWVIAYWDRGFDIIAFDMSSDEFRIIQIPDALIHMGQEFKFKLELELAIYGDSIVLLSFNSYGRDDKFVDMWVLENKGWWSKSSTFGPFEELISPLGFWKNNELMILIGTDTTLLTMYNISTREFRHVKARGKRFWNSCFRNSIYTYKESLLSLEGEGEGEGEGEALKGEEEGEGEGGNNKLWDISFAFVTNFFKGLLR